MSGRLQALVTALLVAVAHQAFAASSADLAVHPGRDHIPTSVSDNQC